MSEPLSLSTITPTATVNTEEDAFYAREIERQIELSKLVEEQDPPSLIQAWSLFQSKNMSAGQTFFVAGLDTQWADHGDQSQTTSDALSTASSSDSTAPLNQPDRVEGVAVCVVLDLVSSRTVHIAVKHIRSKCLTSNQSVHQPASLSPETPNDQPTSHKDASDHQQYRPGFLSLRESSHYVELIQGLPVEYAPQVCLIDGGGRFHPRRAGLACSVGVATGIPTVGVAKTVLRGILEDDPDEKQVRAMLQKANRQSVTHAEDHLQAATQASSHPPYHVRQLMLNDTHDVPLVCAVAPASGAKPVYVSVGHRISLSTASEIVAVCQSYVNPEPLRLADIEARKRIRDNKQKGKM